MSTRERTAALREDFVLLTLDTQLAGFEQDMTREFEGRMATVDNAARMGVEVTTTSDDHRIAAS